MGNSSSKFDFQYLWDELQRELNTTGITSSRVVDVGDGFTLTNKACLEICGSGWRWYPSKDILDRLLTWKVPFLQLWFLFSRPPLMWHCQIFALAHLLGNPINSIASLLYTLAQCQSIALHLRRQTVLARHPASVYKEFTLILMSYNECGVAGDVSGFIVKSIKELHKQPRTDEEAKQQRLVSRTFRELARSLAADRSTKFLPIAFSQVAFITVFWISFRKTNSPIGKDNWIQVEAQSIAISILFLWLTTAVFLSSIIGVSQTELEIPRRLNMARLRLKDLSWLLEDLPKEIECEEVKYDDDTLTGNTTSKILKAPQVHVRRISDISAASDPDEDSQLQPPPKSLATIPRRKLDYKQRIKSGGMYSYRPTLLMQSSLPYLLTAWSLVTASVFVSTFVSGTVPPEGIDCRHIAEITVWFIWTQNLILDYTCTSYWSMFAKDMLAASGVLVVVILVQFGIFNRCNCWSMFGLRPLMLPQVHLYTDLLATRINGMWPWVTYAGVGFQLAFCAGTAWWYVFAFRVYVQRDDGKSNLSWFPFFQTFVEWLEGVSEWKDQYGAREGTKHLVDEDSTTLERFQSLYIEFPGADMELLDITRDSADSLHQENV